MTDGRPAGGAVQYSTTPQVASSSPASSDSSSAAGSTATEFESPLGASGLSSGATRPSGPYASRTGHRDIERSAQMVLGTEPADVRTDAAKVFDAVHAANGIVLRSSVSDGAEGEAGAEFELLIPNARLGDALAAFSRVAEVRSRQESTQDITAPTIGVEERLRDSQARKRRRLGYRRRP